jgi:hypothetical protein
MAIQFIIEDGTGKDDATAYADLEAADQYLENSDRKTAWRVFSSKERQAALIQGADYIDQTFRNRYKGQRFSSDQRLEWPRIQVRDELGHLTEPDPGTVGSIPEEIPNASIEYALEAASSPLAPTPVIDETGRTVISKREKVDVLEESTQYRDVATPKFRKYPRAELVLRRWLKRATAGLTLRAG